jgi:hypothetical protein
VGAAVAEGRAVARGVDVALGAAVSTVEGPSPPHVVKPAIARQARRYIQRV